MVRLSFQRKILLYFAVVIAAVGAVVILVSTLSIFRIVLQEAESRVAVDLKVARNFLNKETEVLQLNLTNLSQRERLITQLTAGTPFPPYLVSWLEEKRKQAGIDFLTVCRADGQVSVRAQPPYNDRGSSLSNRLVRDASSGIPGMGTVIIPAGDIATEGDGLEEQAFIRFVETPRARPCTETEETAAMVSMAAVPIYSSEDVLVGVLYGGVLLNRNYQMVDYIRDMVFQQKEYRGKPFGTVTIFEGDVRIATNVKEDNGSRAIGTRVSQEVNEKVLQQGDVWLGRAFVVNHWYISAYEPIVDPDKSIIGMLYVGVLEEKYVDMRNAVFVGFFLIIIGGLAAVFVLSYLLAAGLSQPISRVLQATRRIARGDFGRVEPGDFPHKAIHPASYREMEELVANFNTMAQALDKRESELKRANEELRQTNRNYMEILGFVTHEIKNRLGIILGSAYNLKSGVVGLLSDGQAKMVDILLRNSERLRDMIKNYLDLSRIERGELQVIKCGVRFLSDVTEPVLAEFEGQLEANETKLEIHVPEDMYLVADPDLLRVVMENLVSNALKYGRKGGTIRVSAEHPAGYWQVSVWNEGEGVAASEIAQLFTKFTRVGGELRRQQGSGLGLFVTKEILEKHGGRIRVESEQGKWANFVFTLPAAEIEPGEKS